MVRRPPHAGTWCWLIGSVLLTSCSHTTQGPASPAGPTDALRNYSTALRQGQIDLAYRLLSADLRRDLSQESFRQFVSSGTERLRRFLAAAETADPLTLQLSASVKLKDGTELVLVRENEGWHIQAGPVVPSLGYSPEAALQQFLDAVESKDCKALLACAPPRVLGNHPQEQLLRGCESKMQHLQDMADKLRSVGAKPVLVAPDRAELTYFRGQKLTLVKVESRWYIEDL